MPVTSAVLNNQLFKVCLIAGSTRAFKYLSRPITTASRNKVAVQAGSTPGSLSHFSRESSRRYTNTNEPSCCIGHSAQTRRKDRGPISESGVSGYTSQWLMGCSRMLFVFLTIKASPPPPSFTPKGTSCMRCLSFPIRGSSVCPHLTNLLLY
jgi:hypothetical protein